MAGLLAAALVPLALLGFYVRPTSDDWCFVPIARDGGFSAMVAEIYQSENGRLGNGAVLGLIYPTYDVASKVLPGLMLVAFLLMFLGVWRGLLRHSLGTSGIVAWVCASALAAGTVLALLLGKLRPYQTLYHSPTVVSHTMPVLIAGMTLVAVLFLNRRGKILLASAVALVGGAVLGTFNEAFTIVCLASVLAGLSLRWLVPRHALHWVVLGSGGAGLLVGFLSVFLSPGSRKRQKLIHAGSVFEPALLKQTVRSWLRVVGLTFSSGEGVLLLLVAAVVGVFLGVSTSRGWGPHSMRVRIAALVVPAVWAVGASLTAVYIFVYSFGGILGRERVWPSITVSLLVGATWYVLLLSQYAAQRVAGGEAATRQPRLLLAGAAVSLPLLALFVISSYDLLRDGRLLIRTTVARSVAWDEQQTVLRGQIAAGATSLVVRPVPIDRLYEPFYPDPKAGWPASCAPAFYGVDRIVSPFVPAP